MTARLALAAFCVLSIAADAPDKADLEAIQGTWVLSAMESEGEDVPKEHFKAWTAEYQGNRVTFRDGERVRRRGIVTLDPSRNPKAVNTWDQDGPYEDRTVPGIYEVDGDTLKLCFARPGDERPKAFTTKDGTGFLFCIYKRKKP